MQDVRLQETSRYTLDQLAAAARRLNVEPEVLAEALQQSGDQYDLTQAPGALCVKNAPCVEECKPRENPLPKLSGVACQGRFVDPQPRDPLVLLLENVKPGAELFLMVRRRGETWDSERAIKLPTDTEKYVRAANPGDPGSYNIVLGDDWLADHKIEAGAVLELRQAMPDGSRESDGFVVPINDGRVPAPRNGRKEIHLPPGDRVGHVDVKQLLAVDPDCRPPQVAPNEIAHKVAKGEIVVSGELEPFAQVAVENWATGAIGKVVTVGEDGKFTASVAGDRQPFVLHVVDHSNSLDGQLKARDRNAERILTGIAGTLEPPVLAQNPLLGVDGPPELKLGRISVSGEKMIAERAVTPGSLVRVLNESADRAAEFKSVASLGGSFVLPADLHVDDIVQIEVRNPHRTGSDTTTTIRAKVTKGEGGCVLEPIEGFGDYARVTSSTKGAVKKAENVDRVTSSKPESRPLPFQITGIQGGRSLTFALQLATDFGVSQDGRGAYQASIKIDRENRKLVITLDGSYAGGYLKKLDRTATPTANATLEPEHRNGAYPQNFPYTVTGDWRIEVVDPEGRRLASASAQGERKSETTYSSSYDGRGGILANPPRATAHTSQYTVFTVSGFQIG